MSAQISVDAARPSKESSKRYLKMYIGSEDGEPGITFYEVDKVGWIYRFVQVSPDGYKFCPEGITHRQAVNLEGMLMHPASEEISPDDFEAHWDESENSRPFRQTLPDPSRTWQGQSLVDVSIVVRWVPNRHGPLSSLSKGWTKVPGFAKLFVWGDLEMAWRAQDLIFLESEFDWMELRLQPR